MTSSIPRGPRRIVRLTEEPTETLYLLGEHERIVGISAYTVRPPEAKRDKPVVSAFIGGSVQKIILQSGPEALTDGLDFIERAISES